jgi:hypothetical protein
MRTGRLPSHDEMDHLLLMEAVRDLEAESRGVPASIGEMQRASPEAYRIARELALGLADIGYRGALSIQQAQRISNMIHSENEGLGSIQDVLNMQPVNALTLIHLVKLERKHTAKNSANARHNRPGGSRDKKAGLREIWASGKYDTRVLCAEEEHEALGVSFSTAQKWLQGTPDHS